MLHEDLNILITRYEKKINKTNIKFGMIIQAINSCENKHQCLKKIMTFILDTPLNVCKNKKGTPHYQIKNLFDFEDNADINFNLVSDLEFVKVRRFLINLGIPTNNFDNIFLNFLH